MSMQMRGVVESKEQEYIVLTPKEENPVQEKDPVQEEEVVVYDQHVVGPSLFDVLWRGVQALIGKERLLEDEKKNFAPKWEAADFVGKLEMVLHLRDEITLTNCQNAEAIEILSPFLEAPEFEPLFKELEFDYVTLIGAVHDSTGSAAKAVVGRFRDHLDTYLTHVMRETMKMMGRSDISSHRKVVELFRIMLFNPKPEDGDLTVYQAFWECYQHLPEKDRVIWREAYRAKGASGSDQMLDFGMQKASFVQIIGCGLVLIKNQGIDDPYGKEKDLALLGALSDAQAFHQPQRARKILGDIEQFSPALVQEIIKREQDHLAEQDIRAPLPKGGYIRQDPLSEIARYGVAETIKALS
jgi:hypothetical protein